MAECIFKSSLSCGRGDDETCVISGRGKGKVMRQLGLLWCVGRVRHTGEAADWLNRGGGTGGWR
jgi:hypothetical protein